MVLLGCSCRGCGLAIRLMIRGIYSTALVRLALRNGGFEIVSPTESQRRRFSIPENNSIPDVSVNDTSDRHGIKIQGEEGKIAELVKTIKEFDNTCATWWKGSNLCVVAFSMNSKSLLDGLRSEVAYTVPMHHYCRSGSEGLSILVSLAEKMVEDGIAEPNVVSEIFEKEVNRLMPRIGSIVKILHTKLNGKRIHLSPGKVVWRRNGEIRIVRRIVGGGVYDGLGIPKSMGDTAVMQIKRGQPYTITKYYSINGQLKGEYYNICTPVEIYDSYIRYIDLGVDVVKPAGGEPRIIDMEELEQGHSTGVISEDLYRTARETAEHILKEI